MSQNRQKDYLFNYFISGLDKAMQATLWSMYHNSNRHDAFNHRRELEEMKREITEDVLSRLSVTIDIDDVKRAVAELRKLLDDLGGK